MVNYVREQSVGELVRNTFAIFGKGLGVILLTYLLPMLPFTIWQVEAQAAKAIGLLIIAIFFATIASLLAFGAITISVSDICLGNAPSLLRSYRKVFRLFGRMFTASMLQLIFIIIGFVLLCIPGIIAMLWFIFTPCIVVIEGLGGLAAVKRSKAIGQSYNWRNLGVFALVIVIAFVAYVILLIPLLLLFPDAANRFVGRFFNNIFQLLGTPLGIVSIVLMYYDLRVRKEAYEAAALAEDLRR
jgi:hypothetical protein